MDGDGTEVKYCPVRKVVQALMTVLEPQYVEYRRVHDAPIQYHKIAKYASTQMFSLHM